MSDQDKMLSKKRGRPATGQGTLVGVRLQPGELARLDTWIAKQSDYMSRPEGLRALAQLGFAADAAVNERLSNSEPPDLNRTASIAPSQSGSRDKMNPLVDKLADTLRLLETEPPTNLHISRIFQFVRQVIEEHGEKALYSLLHMYCDWMMHPKIDRSKKADSILAWIDEAILVQQSWSSEGVRQAMGKDSLKNDFTAFLAAHSLPDRLVTDSDLWREFLRLALADLCEKPLHISDKARKPKSLAAPSRLANMIIVSAKYTNDPSILSIYHNSPGCVKADFVLELQAAKVNDLSAKNPMMIPIVI